MKLRALEWVLSVIFPSTDAVPGIADLPDTRQRLSGLFDHAPFRFQLALSMSTLVFCVAPLITIGVPLPAFMLPRSALERHAQRLAVHRLYLVRQTMLVLKSVGGLVWGGHPMVRTALELPLYGDDPGTFRIGHESWQTLNEPARQQP